MGVNALATGGVITAGEFARNTLTRPDMSTGNALHDAANKGVSAAYLSFGMLMLGEYLFPRTNGTVGCPEEGSGSTGGKKGGTPDSPYIPDDEDIALKKGYSEIGGYIAKYDDVSHITGYDNVVESSRLDYVTETGIRPYPEGGDAYGYIKFTTEDVDRIEIPYGKVFGGKNTDTLPCTLNGFTGARNGEIIPEWTASKRLTPDYGSELHKVVNGTDSIIGVFDGEHFR